MVLTIISLVLAIAALAVCVVLVFRMSSFASEVEKLDWYAKGINASLEALKKQIQTPSPVNGLECASYDPETTTTTFDGNVVVKGDLSAGGVLNKGE